MLAKPLIKTLISLGKTLQSTQDPWWIFGSAAMALHDFKVDNVNDIDVIISPSDAARLMHTHNLENKADGGTCKFQSEIILTPFLGDIPVEIFASFQILDKGKWQSVSPLTREEVKVDDISLFIPSKHDLAEIFEACGRPNDLRHANALRQ